MTDSRRKSLRVIVRDLAADGISPNWVSNVPHCSDSCPKHDGKRCEALGHRPGDICEPAVVEMAEALT
jgi:hypothetical protein